MDESQSSDIETTKSEADAVEAMISSEGEKTKTPHILDRERSPRGKSDLGRPKLSLKCPITDSRIMSLHPVMSVTPTLHPHYLPYKTQHCLLRMMQAILGECCFQFGRLCLSEVLKARSYECVESLL